MQVDLVAYTLSFTQTVLPITYFGLSLGTTSPDRTALLPLMHKIQRRMAGYRGKLLSRVGKLQLCKSVISAIPIFHMSCFCLPAWLVREIDKVRRAFIWSKGTQMDRGLSLISWDSVCLPKLAGGLGLVNLKLQNFALLVHWWWRLYSGDSSIWRQTVTSIYSLAQSASRLVLWRKRGSFFWSILQSIKFILLFSTNWELDNGRKTSFWTDNWGVGNLTLAHDKPASIAANLLRCNVAAAKRTSSLLFPRPLEQHWAHVALALHSVNLTSTPDVILWKWTSSAQFTTSSLYRALVLAVISFQHHLKTWSFDVTPSIQLFCYFLQHNRLLTQDKLLRWNIPVSVGCSLCGTPSIETALHLFFACPYSYTVWQLLQQSTGLLPPPVAEDCNACFRSLISNSTPIIGKKRSQVVSACGLWTLWKERNNRIFRGVHRPPVVVLHEAILCVHDCTKHC